MGRLMLQNPFGYKHISFIINVFLREMSLMMMMVMM